jgi:glycosyltransferase involved in cell wall biosynthesis
LRHQNREILKTSQHILIIGFVWPEPNSSAAGNRILQLIELFQSRGWKVTFASPAADSEHAFDVEKLGVDKVSIELNNKSFDVFISNLQPTMVVFDRFMIEEQFGWRVAEHCPNALRILDTIDLHCLRLARQYAFKENREFVLTDLISDTAKREIASIYRCDIALIISDYEMELLQQQFKINVALLHYVPFLLDSISDSTIANWLPFEERNHFITIGNFLHEPNWNAVQYLKQDIWPLIRKKLPEAQLHIYGSYASQKVNELHKPNEGFYIKGRAKDANEVASKAKVCLAPLRFGAGIKGKLVEAMQCGTPSVTTDIGAEGMHGAYDWNGIIANDAQHIASAAIDLYTNKNVWQKSQENGVTIINNFYSKNRLGKELLSKLLSVQQNVEKHRQQNFTGAMLMHHTMTGTKYMAKWIEEKNKKSN